MTQAELFGMKISINTITNNYILNWTQTKFAEETILLKQEAKGDFNKEERILNVATIISLENL